MEFMTGLYITIGMIVVYGLYKAGVFGWVRSKMRGGSAQPSASQPAQSSSTSKSVDWAKVAGAVSGAIATIWVATLLNSLIRDTMKMQDDRMEVDRKHIAQHEAITADVRARPHLDTMIVVSKGDTVKFFLPRYRNIAITPETADRYAIRIEKFDGTTQILEHDPKVRHVELPHPLRAVEVIGKSDKPVRIHLSTE